MTNLRQRVLCGSVIAGFTALSILTLAARPAGAERFALDRGQAGRHADFRIELRHGVELRYDGATQVSLSAQGRGLAQLELSVARPSPEPRATESADGDLQSELYHWRYYHVDGVAFWLASTDLPGDPELVGVDEDRWNFEHRVVRPHVSVGKAASRPLSLAIRSVREVDGTPLYLGILRLDGKPASDEAGALRWRGAGGWPLAILVADTHAELWFLAGQAQWTYDEATREGSAGWSAPPMCARCRDPEVGRVDVEMRREEDRLRIGVRFSDTPEVEMVAAEGLRLQGRRLGDDLLAQGKAGATYELDLDDDDARDLVAHAMSGDLAVAVEMATGIEVEPEHSDFDVGPELRAWLAGSAGDEPAKPSEGDVTRSDDFPEHLSPRLLQSWPNPFQDRTTIEVTVPSTLGEAFDLSDELLKRVDPRAPVPFGGDPLVRVRVYNVGGQLIRLLSEEARAPGRYSIGWDGNDLSGRPVAAGAYYVNVEIGDYNVTQRVLRLRG
jgi:hypothetical protein